MSVCCCEELCLVCAMVFPNTGDYLQPCHCFILAYTQTRRKKSETDYRLTAGKQVNAAPCKEVAMTPGGDMWPFEALVSCNLMSYI